MSDSAEPNIGKAEFKKIFRHLVLASKKHVKDFSKKEKNILSRKIEELETNNIHHDDWITSKIEKRKFVDEIKKKAPKKIMIVRPKMPGNKREILEIRMHIQDAKNMYAQLNNKKGIDKARVQKLKETIENLEKTLELLKQRNSTTK